MRIKFFEEFLTGINETDSNHVNLPQRLQRFLQRVRTYVLLQKCSLKVEYLVQSTGSKDGQPKRCYNVINM